MKGSDLLLVLTGMTAAAAVGAVVYLFVSSQEEQTASGNALGGTENAPTTLGPGGSGWLGTQAVGQGHEPAPPPVEITGQPGISRSGPVL